MKKLFLLLFTWSFLASSSCSSSSVFTVRRDESPHPPGFTVDRRRGTFLLDGHPFRYVSGSVHYFRVRPELWRDRLRKLRAAGFNAVQTYVEWSRHQPAESDAFVRVEDEVVRFVRTAGEEGLLVILRPGPFIDAERDLGGMPWWLLAGKTQPPVRLRSSDPRFLAAVDRWLALLYGKLRPLMRHNGGPIIMVQVENEYGSYGCDLEYLSHLRDLALRHLGRRTFLFSTDGHAVKQVRCGRVPGVYSTVDFGASDNVTQAFHVQRLFEPDGALVNSEFYPGWLDHWGEPHRKVPSSAVTATMDEMLGPRHGANVNVYLAHGGTSFGFGAGANAPPFAPEITSYDYDAPISEAGDLTTKYFEMKAIISKYLPIPRLNVANSTKAAYGVVKMRPLGTILDLLKETSSSSSSPSSSSVVHQFPLTFESVGHDRGFMTYETVVGFATRDPARLAVAGIADRGYVYVDRVFAGILSRWGDMTEMPITIRKGQKLQIIVENQGRICFGKDLFDAKGITSNVTVDGHTLRGWKMTPIKLDDIDEIVNFFQRNPPPATARQDLSKMTFWKGVFKGPCKDSNGHDTFLDPSEGWSKGVAFLNGFNLGRYWPSVGPQLTLYAPAPVVLGGCRKNVLVLLEQDGPACAGDDGDFESCVVTFTDSPKIDGPTPDLLSY